MKITSKYSGACALCGAGHNEGDEVEYEKDCAVICLPCKASGKRPPPKGAPGASARAGSSGAKAGSSAAPSAGKTDKLLAEIRDLLTEHKTILLAIRDALPAPTMPGEPPDF